MKQANIFFLTSIISILINFSFAYSSSDVCINFFTELTKINTNNTIISKRVLDGIGLTPGTTLGRKYTVKDGWSTITKNGYPVVTALIPGTEGEIVLRKNDMIIEFNGEDLKEFPEDMLNLDSWYYFLGQKVDLLIKRNDGIEDKLIELTLDVNAPDIDVLLIPELKILDITEINAKKGTYSINYEFNYYWEDQAVFDVAKSVLTKGVDTTESAALGFSCKLTEKEFINYDFKIWQPKIKFKNEIITSDNNKKVNYYFSAWHNPVTKVQGIEISRLEYGLSTFSNKFHFENFPFDRQILNLDFIDQSGEDLNSKVWVSNMWLYDSDYLTKFVDNNNLFDWNINSYSHKYFEETDLNYGVSSFGISNSFELQRNSTYYIFKIIGPIFLILIVCWSVMWLTARELESRLTVTTVCLLSLVAYNFVIDQDLPKLAYFTKMDYIISLSYLFAALPTLISVLEYRFIKLYDREIPMTNLINYSGPLIYIAIVFGIIVS